jgi:PAS domain S-box-containing protein
VTDAVTNEVKTTGAAATVRNPDVIGASSALAAAAALGLPALAGLLVGTDDGLCLVDADRRYVYANPAACQMFGHPLEQLRGRDFLDTFPSREHATLVAHLPQTVGGTAARFTSVLYGADGSEREMVCLMFAIDIDGSPHGVAILQDITGPRAAARTAVALSQTTAQLVGTGPTGEILAGLARHAVEGTRAVVCGIAVVSDDHKIVSVGAYSSPENGLPPGSGKTRSAAWDTFAGVTGEEVVEATYFEGCASVAGTLIDLLFVAISVSPHNDVGKRAPLTFQVQAAVAFTTLLNALVVALVAVLPGNDLGSASVFLACTGISSTIGMAGLTQRNWPGARHLWGLAIIPALGALYIIQLLNGIDMLLNPTDTGTVHLQALLIIVFFMIAIARAWQMIGARDTRLAAMVGDLLRERTTTIDHLVGNRSVADGSDAILGASRQTSSDKRATTDQVFERSRVRPNPYGPVA